MMKYPWKKGVTKNSLLALEAESVRQFYKTTDVK